MQRNGTSAVAILSKHILAVDQPSISVISADQSGINESSVGSSCHKVLMFLSAGPKRSAIADELIRFADEQHRAFLSRDKDRIVSAMSMRLKNESEGARNRIQDGNPPDLRSAYLEGIMVLLSA